MLEKEVAGVHGREWEKRKGEERKGERREGGGVGGGLGKVGME